MCLNMLGPLPAHHLSSNEYYYKIQSLNRVQRSLFKNFSTSNNSSTKYIKKWLGFWAKNTTTTSKLPNITLSFYKWIKSGLPAYFYVLSKVTLLAMGLKTVLAHHLGNTLAPNGFIYRLRSQSSDLKKNFFLIYWGDSYVILSKVSVSLHNWI